jgi:hypothetical protein
MEKLRDDMRTANADLQKQTAPAAGSESMADLDRQLEQKRKSLAALRLRETQSKVRPLSIVSGCLLRALFTPIPPAASHRMAQAAHGTHVIAAELQKQLSEAKEETDDTAQRFVDGEFEKTRHFEQQYLKRRTFYYQRQAHLGAVQSRK